MESAERAVAQYAASGWDKNPDDMDAALFSIFTLADPVKKALGHDLFSVIDMRAAISKCADGLRTTVPSGGAIDFVSARYSSQVHACVLLRSAMENNDGLAMWLYQNIFKDAPASSRDADEIYSLLWFDERAKPAPPTWFTEKSQAELAAKLEKIVKEACLADAAERVKARGRLRPTVKAQRALAVPFSAEWLQKADTSVLADFQVSIKPELLEQHPRLFFTKNEMPLLYARIASCQAKMWEPFIEFMEKNLTTPYRTMQSYREQGGLGTGTGDTLAAFAFTYALAKDDAYGEIVKRFVQGYCAEEIWDPPHPDLVHAHVLTGLSLAYDVAQQCLMPEERLMVRDKLILEARRMFTGTCAEKRVRTPGNANNHSWIQKCGLAIAATAIYEHAPEAKAWLDRVRWEYEKILEVHGPDGASCEGTSYWAYGLQWMLKYMELLRHTSGEDMYEYPWLRQTGYYALYCLSPGGALHVNFGDNGEDQGRVSFIPYRLASEFRDEHIQWLGDLLHWNPNLKGKSGASMWSLLWYDPTVAVKAPNDLPPYRYFDDLEMVIVKSGWQDDARMLAFRCGPPMGHSVFAHGAGGYGHAHPDQNHFIFFAGGSRFIVSDPGYSRWKMTSEHNLVLVDGLGQIGEEEHWLHYVYKADELAEMQEVFLSPSYSYMRGQALKAYRREAGVQNFTREVMFLDGKYLIAFDTVNTDAPRKYEWLLHSWNPIQSEKNGLFTSTQDDARLATALLMPEQFEQKTEAMMVKSAVKWGLDGKPIYVQEPVQHGYYLTVWPKEKTPTANFLAVLWPYTKGAEDKVPKIVRFAGENCIGAAIDEPEQRDRIIFNLSGAPVEAEGISTDAPRAVVRLNEAYEPTAYIVHGGRTLTCGACELVRSSGPVVLQFDAISGKGVLQAKTPGDIALYAPRAVKSVKANAEVRPFTYDSKTKTVRFQAAQGRADLAIE
jgi:hypothetical protein